MADWRSYKKRRQAGVNPTRRIDSTGTRRRLQALHAMGHPWTVVAPQVGLTVDTVARIARGSASRRWVGPTTARAVANLARRWEHQPGTCTRTRNYAAAEGWHTFTAWFNIDDPAEQPTPATASDDDPGEEEEWATDLDAEIRRDAVRQDRLSITELSRVEQERIVIGLRDRLYPDPTPAARNGWAVDVAARLRVDPAAVERIADRVAARARRVARAAATTTAVERTAA